MEVSVSEVTTWQLCHYRWALQYGRRLRPLAKDPRMASGSAVHESVQAILEGKASRDDTDELTRVKLTEQFPGDPYADEKVAKYLAGVRRGLSRMPDWVWEESAWHIEELFTYSTWNDAGELSVRMKPDLYKVGDDVITIVEIKTTEHDPVDYLLTSPQHEWYGLGLDQRYDHKLISFIYLCVPVGDRAKVPPPQLPYMFSRRRMDESAIELQEGALRLGEDEKANRGWWCNYCDFKAVCTARVTGGSTEDVIETQYEVRPERVESVKNETRRRPRLTSGADAPIFHQDAVVINEVYEALPQAENVWHEVPLGRLRAMNPDLPFGAPPHRAIVNGEIIEFPAGVNPEDVGIHADDVIEPQVVPEEAPDVPF